MYVVLHICSSEQVEERVERWTLEDRGMKPQQDTEYLCVKGKVRLQDEKVKKVQDYSIYGSDQRRA